MSLKTPDVNDLLQTALDFHKQKAPVSRGLLVFLGLPWITAWWTRSQRIRTEGEVPFEAALMVTEELPMYQRIAEEAEHLRLLGLNDSQVAQHLGVDSKTVAKAIRWKNYKR